MVERENLSDSNHIAYQPLPSDEDESLPYQIRSAREESPIRGGNFVYFCFLLLGLGTLLPWNFFITADSYWQYKFRNATEGADDWKKRETQLQKLYDPMQVCLSQVTCFIFLVINALFSHIWSQKARLFGSLSVLLIFFALTAILVKVDTDSWQKGFFALTMIVIFIMSASTALFQGSLFGLAGRFPERFINGVAAGQALGGVFASLARIGSIVFGVDDVTSAFIYFLVAVVVMAFTLVELMCVSRTHFFKYYATDRQLLQQPHQEEEEEGGVEDDTQKWGSFTYNWNVFKAIWPLGVTVGGVFVVTLSVFPVVCVKVLSTSTNFEWAEKYFQPVSTFLFFNVSDYLGRMIAEFLLLPQRALPILYSCALLRFGFVPLLLLCNHNPHSAVPSVFLNDAWYMVFMAFFGLSNGYIVSVCMMYAPSMVPVVDAEKAAGMMAAMIGLGLLLGSVASFGFVLIT